MKFFKPGDKVRIVDRPTLTNKNLLDKILTIGKDNSPISGFYPIEEDNGYMYNEEYLELVSKAIKPKLKISFNVKTKGKHRE